MTRSRPPRGLGELAEIKIQRIALMQRGRARQGHGRPQALRQVPIDFHGIKTGVVARQQQMGEGAAARTDFQQVILRARD